MTAPETARYGEGRIVQRNPNDPSRLTLIVDDLPDPVTRKRRRRWITFKQRPNETDKQLRRRVESERHAMLAKKAEGKSDLVPSRLSVKDSLQKWLDDYVEPNLGPRTLRSYSSLLRRSS
jgi:hypothetical protein